MKIKEFVRKLQNGSFDQHLKMLYGDDIKNQKIRYEKAAEAFEKQFPHHCNDEIAVFSAPGRTEIGGNHTDHQHGCVLAAAVNLDVIAIVHFNEDKVIRLKSKGYPMDTVELSDLSVRSSETGTSAALIRGMASCFAERGIDVTGFDAYTTSDVLSGSGLSSSAAFEILVGTIINSHDNSGKFIPAEIARFGQYAENVYYGKNSGLMDQTVSAVGGLVFVDFFNTENPQIISYDFDFSRFGYEICITDTKGSHSGLSDEYSSVTAEMCHVAEQFGFEYLRQLNPSDFMEAIPKLRTNCSDREILRAIHFFDENSRVHSEVNALLSDDISKFCELVRQSGESSANLLQNQYSVKNPSEQGIPLGIAISKKILNGKGAARVHGGGFAGTIQAFVPKEMADGYREQMEKLFGKGCCYILKIRPVGGIEITEE